MNTDIAKSPPQVVVLGRLKRMPLSSQHISVSPEAEIRTVDVRVRAIGFNAIDLAKAISHLRRVLSKTIHVDDPCDGPCIGCSERYLPGEPICRCS